MTSQSFALGDEFWAAFHETHWEKLGTVLKQPFAPLATPDETFDCLVEASDRYRRGDAAVALEFCIGNTQLLANVGAHLPARADATLDGYAARVTDMLAGRRFGLVVQDVQAYDAELWLRLRDFLRPLYTYTGMPGDSAKATIFAGNYDRTPFGLHRGSSGNFMFVVDGEKRMRTWPDAFFHGKEDLTYRLDYERYNDDSIVLDAGVGDVIYWPSDYWHIGESSDGRMSAAVSLALFMDPRPADDLTSVAGRMALSRLAAAEAGVDDVVAREVSALRSVASDPRLELALRQRRLNRATAYGFTRPPASLAMRALGDDEVVVVPAQYPLAWIQQGDDLMCSACGQGFRITASPPVLALLERLNSAQPARVGALAAEYAGTAMSRGVEVETAPDDVRAILEKLLSIRGVTPFV